MKRHASMNRVYRLVWSRVRSAWVAVAETARGQSKGSSRKLVAAALSLAAAVAQAAPSGGQIAAGAGSISQSGATTTIQQSSPNLSLNWNSFNIAPQETVNFQQPSAAAIAVNRIFDTNGTQILGHLNANGQVWLVNPNGILFGQGAQVNVGGIVASTLNLNDAGLNGHARTFSGNGTGSVVNQGNINAADGGYVALLGNTVSNQGVISARLGTVALGAGSAATLTFSGNSLVKMQVDQSVLASLAENGGLIQADGGMVVMNAGAKNALLASVVNNTGVVEARTVENREGVITLLGGMTAGTVNVGGTLDASAPNGGKGGAVAADGTLAGSNADGVRGGEVQLLGDKVTLTAGALVDVSGAQGGGTALIGGDYQGKNPAVINARTTLVAPGATVRADATAAGNGGKVIVWADGSTVFSGAISARGGTTGGDGGFAEVSGKGYLAYRGIADLRAPNGSTGTLLLDPTDITITGAGAGNDFAPTFGAFVGGVFAGGANNTSTIYIGTGGADTNSTLLKQLGLANVIITTASAGAGTGNITVDGAITNASSYALTLTAENNLTISAPIFSVSALTLNSGNALALGANVSGSTVTLNNTGALTQSAGSIAATTALNLTGVGSVGTSGAPLATSAATIVLNKAAGAGATFINDSALLIPVAVSGSTGGGLTLNADSGISVGQNLTTAGVTTLNADKNNDGTGTFTIANNITLTTTDSTLNLTAADMNIVFFGALNSGTAATSITASADRSIGLGGTAGDLTLTNGEMGRITASSLALNTTGLTGDMTVNGINFVGTLNSGPVTLNAGGTVTFATAGSTFYHGLTVNANDGIAVGADITASNGNIVLDGDADSIASPGDGIAFTGTPTLTTGIDYIVPHDPTQGSIILRNGATGANGNITSAGLNLRAADNITIEDDLTATAGTFSAIANNPGGRDYLNSVNGTFTLASGKTLATVTSGNIDIMATYVALDGSLNSVAAASITASRNMPVSLGTPVPVGTEAVQLNLSDAALGRITATGLTIGNEATGFATIYVNGVTAANTSQFGTLTLTTPGAVWFEGTSVVGNRLIATGLGGVGFGDLANLSTSTAAIANPDITLTANNILFNTAVTVSAGGTGTLTLSPTDTFMTAGTLTLESGDNLVINRDLSVYGPLTLNADKNNDGTGTLSVASGVTVSTTGTFGPQPINIIAADIDLPGTAALNSGTGATSITASAGRSIGLGATVAIGGLNITGSELQQITATGLTLTSGGNITVDGITAANSNNITGTTTLTANGVASQVNLLNNASTFHALTVNSTTTIANNATLTLNVGDLTLNAGTDITQTGAIEIGAGTANLTGETITLAHPNNTMGDITVNSGSGDVSIREDAAISIAGVTRTSGNLTLNAATDITQSGAIAIGTGTANFTAGNVTLNHASNVLGAITVNAGTGNIALTENDAIAVAGITHTGTLGLTANGAITDIGPTVVSGTTTLAAGSTNDIVLDAANDFATVVVTSGNNVTLNDLNALALGNVTAAGALLVTAGGNLTLNSGATIAATGAVANPLVLVAGGNFINSSGAAALDAGGGRWLVYSTSPAGSTENGLTAAAGSTLPRLYNKTIAGNSPATIAAGNHLIYSAQPTLTVTADDKTRAYGDANPSFTATTTGFVSDDGVTDTLTTAGLAGAAALTSLATATDAVSGVPFAITAAAGTLASSAGYAFGFADGLLTITPATLTLSGTRAYNGTTAFAGTNLIAAGVNGETFAVTGVGAVSNLSTKNVQTNQTLASVTGLTLGSSGNGGIAGNYNSLATAGSSVSVTTADLALSGTRVYNGTTVFAGSNLTAAGVNGETFAVTGVGDVSNLSTKNVQTNQTLASVTGLTLGSSGNGGIAGNYNSLATTGSSVSVTPKPITATGIIANNKVYNANDVVILNTGSAAITGGATTDVDNKFYTSDLLTLNAAGATGVFTSSVFVLGKDVGTAKTVSVSGLALTNNAAGNYTLTGASGVTANITAKPITASGITANNKVYNANDVAILNTASAAITGGATTDVDNKYYTGDTVTLDTSSASGTFTLGKDVGAAKAVSVSGLALTNNAAGNYSLTGANGTSADITAKPITATGITANSKVYNANDVAILTGGVITGGAATDVDNKYYTGDVVALDTSGASGTFTLGKDVGNAKAVSVSGLALSGGDMGNYTLTGANGTSANITAKPITAGGITANSKVYNANAVAILNTGSAAITGGATTDVDNKFYTGDLLTLNAAGATGVFTLGKDVGTAKAVSVSGLALGNNAAGNYTLTGANGASADITPKLITATGITANSKVYNANDVAILNTGSAAITGGATTDVDNKFYTSDLLTLNAAGATGVFTLGKDVGTAKAVSVSGLALGNNAAGNYTLTGANGTSADITAKPITASGITANSKVYNANDVAILNTGSAAITGGATSDVDNKFYTSDLLTLNAASATGVFTLGKDVGAAKAVSVSGLALGNNAAGNYTLTGANGPSADITKAPLTVTADDKTRLYGAANPTLTTTVSGFVNGENAGTAAGFGGAGAATTSAVVTTPVGTAPIAAGAGNLTATNYAFTYLVDGTLTINKAPLTVTADDKTRVYGAVNPILTSTVSGFVNGENAGTAAGFAGAANDTTEAGATTTAGTALITAGAGDLTATNYAFTRLVNGTLTITPGTQTTATTPPTETTPPTAATPPTATTPPTPSTVTNSTPKPDTPPKPVETAPAQLQSGILAPQASTKPEEISLSPTLTVTRGSSSDASAANEASASDSGNLSPAEPRWRVAIAGGDASSSGSGNGTVVNTMMTIGGGMGPSLRIMNGGVKLPDDRQREPEKAP